MDDSLQTFHQNNGLEKNVKNYLIEFLKGEAIKKVFEKEETKHIAEAKEVIEKAFENLDNLFPKQTKKKEIKNPAR